MPKLLFLCTANYYRSRFAEMLFNHLAAQHQLNWVADSRGIATILGADSTDVISEHTVNGLLREGCVSVTMRTLTCWRRCFEPTELQP